MKNLVAITTLILSALANSAAQAADVGLPAATDDRYCTTCHGVDGRGNIAVQAPRLAGMEDWYLKRQLENFREGIRGTHPADIQGIAMQPMAAKLSDASIADIVSWVGSWEYVAAETTVVANARRGRTAFQSCAACHGTDAEGNEALGAPALAGQNDWYLVTQLKNFRGGLRGAHQDDTYGAQMISMSRTLVGDAAILDVVSYINSL
ncbi:MAG: c-type cytochrome [Proteobacteria bacterium]|nr:c-type cytochrome [Pseudomonadota bacterium]MCH8265684.1 c-type cytochrome [Pseudomonadota bacterium]